MGILKNLMNQNDQKIYKSDLTAYSNLIIFQSSSDVFVGKNRYSNTGFVDLPEILDLVIKDYYNVERTEKLTKFTMFNISIKKELEEAIEKVLIKHGIKKR